VSSDCRAMTGIYGQIAVNGPRAHHAVRGRAAPIHAGNDRCCGSDAEADPRLWAPFVVVGEPAKPQ
jgi:hypothetical protein